MFFFHILIFVSFVPCDSTERFPFAFSNALSFRKSPFAFSTTPFTFVHLHFVLVLLMIIHDFNWKKRSCLPHNYNMELNSFHNGFLRQFSPPQFERGVRRALSIKTSKRTAGGRVNRKRFIFNKKKNTISDSE